MIRTGTCSWTEKRLIDSKEFYPKEVKTSESRLRYYAEHFDTVEVDSTYYAIPNLRNIYLWIERTPDNFTFHIKVYGALTGHGINPQNLPKDIYNLLAEKDKSEKQIHIKEPSLLSSIAERFLDILSPLLKSNKLGVLVFQFPPWLQYRTQNLDYILTCKSLMKNLPVAIEFRHGSWLTPGRADSVLNFLKEHQITYITADEPQYGSLATVPFLPYATTDIAYFRLHGRNKENWLKKGIETAERYNYFYSDAELNDFINPVIKISEHTKNTFVMFNNCYGGSSVKNALRLKGLIKAQIKIFPGQEGFKLTF